MSFDNYINRVAKQMTGTSEALQKEINLYSDEMMYYSIQELQEVINRLNLEASSHVLHPRRLAAVKLLNSRGLSSEELLPLIK